MAILSTIKSAAKKVAQTYQSATKGLQSVGAGIASTLSKSKQPAAAAMAFPVAPGTSLTKGKEQRIANDLQTLAASQKKTSVPANLQGLQGGSIDKAIQQGQLPKDVGSRGSRGATASWDAISVPSTLSSASLSSGQMSGAMSLPSRTHIDASGASASAFQTLKNLKGIEEDEEDDDPMYRGLDDVQQLIKQFGIDEAPESKADVYERMERKSQVREYERQVDDYTAQLKAIEAKAQADSLSLEGQGRGIPEAIIGGQQAKIQREAAIKALPIAALLESAQGRYESAQQHLNTMFKLVSDDMDNERQYRMDVFRTVAPYMDKAEQRRLQLIDRDDERRYESEKELVATKQELLKNIMAQAPQGVKQTLFNAVWAASSPMDAIAAAGQYGGKMPETSSTPSESSGLVDANGKPIKLAATQVDTLAGFESTVSGATAAKNLLDAGVKTGPFENIKLQGAKLTGQADPNQLKLEIAIGKIKADYMKALSGAAVSEAEVKRLSAFLPSMADQESVLRTKLESLITESTRGRATYLRTLGATTGTGSDDPLGIL